MASASLSHPLTSPSANSPPSSRRNSGERSRSIAKVTRRIGQRTPQFAHIHSWREWEVQVLDIQDSGLKMTGRLFVWMAAAPLLPSVAAVQPRGPADAETATRRPSLITDTRTKVLNNELEEVLEEVDGPRASALKPPDPRLLELPRPDGRPCRLCYHIWPWPENCRASARSWTKSRLSRTARRNGLSKSSPNTAKHLQREYPGRAPRV